MSARNVLPQPSPERGSRASVLLDESWRDPVERDLEVPRASEERVRPVGRGVDDQSRVLEPAHQRAQRDLRLEPGERRPEAAMDAAAEAEMLIVLAIGNEPLGVGEARRIAGGS